ncbi:helix-turn-helix domain-containing protein [Flexivirga caeni]|uniref:XRE family transcriptional regulator n=1 Tax=Flexivirga caeni TaxID=2294115 RepID=A0A3M9M686_9MICO|nr:helix-turn-helix transcriptional regulator [Flexivirga caeni]RNI20717.1 XRE family transcriptional regulator [Flexivirga caeni]
MNEIHNETIGQLLRRARERSGLSLRQAAAEAGMGKTQLAAWERDEVDSPELGNLLRLAAVLGIDATEACAAAGYDIAGALPTLQPYFRRKYPELPEAALKQITAITEKYGIDPNHAGPRPGEDEQ